VSVLKLQTSALHTTQSAFFKATKSNTKDILFLSHKTNSNLESTFDCLLPWAKFADCNLFMLISHVGRGSVVNADTLPIQCKKDLRCIYLEGPHT
jgi:hypothetical protein